MMKESPVAAAAETAAPSSGDVMDSAAMEAEVAKVIAAVRPAVQADKGDIELISVDSRGLGLSSVSIVFKVWCKVPCLGISWVMKVQFNRSWTVYVFNRLVKLVSSVCVLR